MSWLWELGKRVTVDITFVFWASKYIQYAVVEYGQDTLFHLESNKYFK